MSNAIFAELTRAKAAWDDPTTDRDSALRDLATACIRAYVDLAGGEARAERLIKVMRVVVDFHDRCGCACEDCQPLRAAISAESAR